MNSTRLDCEKSYIFFFSFFLFFIRDYSFLDLNMHYIDRLTEVRVSRQDENHGGRKKLGAGRVCHEHLLYRSVFNITIIEPSSHAAVETIPQLRYAHKSIAKHSCTHIGTSYYSAPCRAGVV